MILVDSSIWIDHFRRNNERLVTFLEAGQVLCHPFILGELALGTLRQRRLILQLLRDLPQAALVQDEEVLAFIERHELAGSGIGYIDAHLLSSSRLAATPLWTRDKRLAEVAQRLRAAY